MLQFDWSEAESFISEKERASAYEKAKIAFQQLQTKSGKGSDWLGWRDMLADPNDALLEKIDRLARGIRDDADVFIVCGIGGSYLGARAVIEALTPFFPTDKTKIIYAGNQMSGRYLEDLIAYLNKKKPDGSSKSVYLNVISKSGTTLETALAFRVLRDWLYQHFANDADKRIVCTTSPSGGALNKLVDAHNYQKFVIPDDVGGRFSVLTPVGLLPIAVAGIDIRSLFYGAVSAYEHFENNPEQIIHYASMRYALSQNGYAIDVITSFEPELRSFGGWMQQLFGESEGKNGKGLFPANLGYSTDLHSMGQLVQQGQRNMMETFLAIKKSRTKLSVPDTGTNDDGLGYLVNTSFHEINSKALQGTRQAHVQGEVPAITVTLDDLTPEHLGWLIYAFELVIPIHVYCLGENPFNQPGVENYKKAMYQLLGKPS